MNLGVRPHFDQPLSWCSLTSFCRTRGVRPLSLSRYPGATERSEGAPGGCDLASLSRYPGASSLHSVTPGGATSLRSAAILVLPHFVLSHQGGDLASLSHYPGAPSLRSVTPGGQPHFTRSLSWCSLTSFCRTRGGDLASLGRSIYRGPIKHFQQIKKWLSTPSLKRAY